MISKLTLAVLAVCLVFSATEASPIYRAAFDCDPVPLQKDFDATSYVGLWYELYRTTNMIFESGTDNTAQYSPNADGSIAVHNREWLPDQQAWGDAYATATTKYNTPGWLSVAFYNPPTPTAGDYRVLETDYENYSIVYSCSKYSSQQTKYGWVLARANQLPQSTIEHIFEVFGDSEIGLKETDFHKTKHGCPTNPDC